MTQDRTLVRCAVALMLLFMAVGRTETVKIRKWRRVARAHISPENTVSFDHRITGRLDLGVHLRPFGLGRLFDTLAGHVEMPAMENQICTDTAGDYYDLPPVPVVEQSNVA